METDIPLHLKKKLTFIFLGGSARHRTSFWVNRTLMMQHSSVVRGAIAPSPSMRTFIYMDFDGISTVFQHVIDYVHGGIVPIGPGGAVGCFSREAVQYIERMFRLYRAALKFGLEELADRVIDEIQSHEHRCNGSLPILWIRDVHLRTNPGSKLRLYCAASLYQSGITMKDGAVETSRSTEFKAVMRRWRPSVNKDIKSISKVFKKAKRRNGRVAVDHRDRSTFGSCVFHLHEEGKVCSAADPEALERRNLGTGWQGWDDPNLQTILGACRSVEHGAAATDDASLVPWSVFLSRNEAHMSAKPTISDLKAAGEPAQSPVPSAKRRKLDDGGVGQTSGNEEGESSSRAEGFPIPNQWGICLPPINQAERACITNFLVRSPKDDQNRTAMKRFLDEAEAKGLDTYIWMQLAQLEIDCPSWLIPKVERLGAKKANVLSSPVPPPKSILKTASPPAPVPRSESPLYSIFSCRSCGELFEEKQDLLDHLTRYRTLTSHSRGGRLISVGSQRELESLKRKGAYFDDP